MRSRFSQLARVALVLVVPLSASRPSAADTVYATSFDTGELIRFDSTDPAGTKTTLLAGGTLVRPAALVMGPDGNLYIGESGDGDTSAPRISRFDPGTLTVTTVYPFASSEVVPGSLVFRGNDLLIGRNPFFGNTGPIMRLANATGGPLAVSDATSGGSLRSSPGLALAPDGRLYVSDQTYNAVTGVASGPVARFDAAGTYVGQLIADGAAGLSGPTGLAITADGSTLYTASFMTGTILQTALATDQTTPFASAGGASQAGMLALLSDGSLLAGSLSGNGTVYRFDAGGTLMSSFASGLGQIGGIATVVVPEPATTSLVAGGLLAAGRLFRSRRRRCRIRCRTGAASASAAV